jgi:ADP-ribose pyrophosphatase YjhB (NUDIX family)
MINFDIGLVRFHCRAAAIALHDGHVLLRRAEMDDFWALPGGHCEVLEPSHDTLTREMREELGVSVTVV